MEWPPSNTWFLRPIRPHNPKGIPIGSAVFAQMTVECPYTLQWDAHCPPKICPFRWGILTPSNTWFPGPTQVLNPNGSSIGAAVFAGLTSVTDRPTDHAARSVRKAASTYIVLRCGLIIHDFYQMNSFWISPHCGLTFSSVVDKFRVSVKFSPVLEIINSCLWLGYSKVLRHSVVQHWFLNSFLVINTRNVKWPKFAFALFFCSRCDGISVKIYK